MLPPRVAVWWRAVAGADLRGLSVAVTADRRRDEQAVMFERAGLEVFMHPLLRTAPEDEAALLALTRQLIEQPPDLFLANTGYGMRAWSALAAREGLLPQLVAALQERTVIGARGAKALGELRKVGLDAKFKASTETLGELVDWAVAQGVRAKTVVLQLHGDGPSAAAGALEAAGARVTGASVYRMADADGGGRGLVDRVLSGQVDVVTFTAAPQLEALAEAASEAGQEAALAECFDLGAVIAACIGPVCAAAATALGITRPLVPEHPRLGSLAGAVVRALAPRQVRVPLAHGEALVSGWRVVLPDGEVRLDRDQQRLLRPLTAEPGQWCELTGAGARAGMAGLAALLEGAIEQDGRRARLWGAGAGATV